MCRSLIGPAADYHLFKERQDILTLLEEHLDCPLRPKEIAALLHKDVRAVTKLLFMMSRANQIRLIGRGHYMTIKSGTAPDCKPFSLDPSSLGNSGNISNLGNEPV